MRAKYFIAPLVLAFIFVVLSISNAPDPMEGFGQPGPASVPMLPELSIWEGLKQLLQHHEAQVYAQSFQNQMGVFPTKGTFSVGVSNTVGVVVGNTVYVTGVPAGSGGGTVFVSNTAGVVVASMPSAAITGTVNVNIVAGAVGGGTVFVSNTPGVIVVSMPSAIITGTVNVNIVAGAVGGGTVFVSNGSQSPIPIATGSANFFVNVQAGATIPVSLPTIGVQVGTVSVATVGALIFNTPAIQGSVSINNTPAVQPPYPLLASATSTNTVMPNSMITAGIFQHLGMGYDSTNASNAYRAVSVDPSGNQNTNIKSTVNIQALSTIPVSLPTIGVTISTAGVIAIPTQSYDVNVKNTPAIQGSVSINNTPGVLIQNASASPVPIATGTANFSINVNIGATVPVSTATAWVVFFTPVTVNINGTPAIQGSVSINNTPAVQGSVSINNTPQVQFATADPCENPGIAKSFVALATASATTSPIVAVNGAQAVYVCGFGFTQPQGVGTVGVQFMNAVNTPCSSTTPLTGIYALGITHPGGYTIFKANQSLCMQRTGAGVDAEGGLTYVQQ